MEEYTWDASGSYLREDSCYFFRIDEKTLFWQKCQNRVYLQSETTGSYSNRLFFVGDRCVVLMHSSFGKNARV